MKPTTTLVLLALLGVLAIYLFVTAPPPLVNAQNDRQSEKQISTAQLFASANAINIAARSIYTGRIVGGGLKAGLKFGEDWADKTVEKGPLPALFLRMTADKLEAKPPQLALFLGSDQPINKSNHFQGVQRAKFEQLKGDRMPRIFDDPGFGRVAMYPDIAAVQPCVTCHNEHPDSPKTDWKLNDVMGATTWIYPTRTVAFSDYIETITALYDSVREAYTQYAMKSQTFKNPPEIGRDWPDTGKRRLPNPEVFMEAVHRETAGHILKDILDLNTVKIHGQIASR